MSPQFADFLKSVTADLLKSSGRNVPPVCRFPQICHCRFTENLQAEIPLVCRFPQICHCRLTEICRQKFPSSLQITSNLPLQINWKSSGRNVPPVSRFPQICHCRFTEIFRQKFPSSLQISSNLQAEMSPQFADFLKSATADLLKIFRQKCPPSLQISSNLSLQIYWNLQAEILLVCRFPQICHCRFP